MSISNYLKDNRRSFRSFNIFLLAAGFAVASLACNNKPDKYKIVPNHDGKRGEECQTSGDCKEKLACIDSTCVKNDFPIDSTAKTCKAITCTENADCEFRQEQVPANCDDLQKRCSEDNDDMACNRFKQQCDFVCEDQQCRPDRSCSKDEHCVGSNKCESGECVQCEEDKDCQTGQKCVDNQCIEGCDLDEHCTALQECKNGQCEEAPCESDRECVLLLGNGQAECKDGKCLKPCQNDAECNCQNDAECNSNQMGGANGFQVCEDGTCEFAGCESDKHCRAVLARTGNPNDDKTQYKCVEKDEE